ncbi:hypothetical protein IMSAG049_01102 [Clostridiales bacterium]|nr:hypothetical protein IMSAG049_01102 [Clostridiales bacterium]
MDENMTNRENENQNSDTAFGSSEYYKKLYDDFPEDVAEMLIGTHPLMKKEVSDELTNGIKVKSSRGRGASSRNESVEGVESEANELVSASKDPIEETEEEEITDYVGDITSFTKGLATPSANKRHKEPEFVPEEPEEPMSESDITAEQVARMLGGVEVEPVEEEEFEELEVERPKKKRKKEQSRQDKPRKRPRQPVEERNLELANIDKQADLNELFREDDDYYDEKHSGNSVIRIAIIIVAIVVLAFFVYKIASLSGQVKKLNEEVAGYKTMETEYEQLKLDNLSLEEQVEDLQAQLNGGTEPGNENNGENSNTTTPVTGTPSSTNSAGSTTYTVQAGDTFWGIATKMYGNGSYYDRILKANGLTENDKIKEGMTLTIPAA